MTELERSLRQVALDLETLDRRFAVVGGLAVSIRAEPRLTRDVDVEVLPGLVLPVATIGHLIVMKLLARDDRRRPNDADDLRALAIEATPADWEQALQAAQLVHERGFGRERDLVELVDELRRDGVW